MCGEMHYSVSTLMEDDQGGFMSVTMSPSLRTRIGSAALAVGIAAALGFASVPTASAASNSFIAAPNGMVGVSEIITI